MAELPKHLSGQKRRAPATSERPPATNDQSGRQSSLFRRSVSLNSNQRPPALSRQSSFDGVQQLYNQPGRKSSLEWRSASSSSDQRPLMPPFMSQPSVEEFEETEVSEGNNEGHGIKVGKRNLTWTDAMDDFLIDSLIDQMHKGQKVGGVFTKTAYATVAILVSERFQLHVHSEHIKNRMKTLKVNFGIAKDLLKTSGFGFNHSTQMIEAEIPVWEAYITAHPTASKVRYKPIKNYEKMDILVGQDRATGSHAAGPRERQLRMDDEDVAPFESTEHEVENDNTAQHVNDTATSISNRQTKKRKTKMNDMFIEELKDIKEGITSVAVALEKSCKSSLELEQQLAQEIEKVDGMTLESQVKAYRALTNNDKAARAFLAITGERRRIWLEMEFGSDIFDV